MSRLLLAGLGAVVLLYALQSMTSGLDVAVLESKQIAGGTAHLVKVVGQQTWRVRVRRPSGDQWIGAWGSEAEARAAFDDL